MRRARSPVKSSPRPWVNPFARPLFFPTTRLSQAELTELGEVKTNGHLVNILLVDIHLVDIHLVDILLVDIYLVDI